MKIVSSLKVKREQITLELYKYLKWQPIICTTLLYVRIYVCICVCMYVYVFNVYMYVIPESSWPPVKI